MSNILRSISRSRVTNIITFFATFLASILTIYKNAEFFVSPQPDNKLWNLVESLNSDILFGDIVNFVIYSISAWVLFKINEHFSLTSVKSRLPFMFFLIFLLGTPQLHLISEGTVASITFPIMIYMLFSAYMKEISSIQSFAIGAIMSVAAMFWINIVLYFPIFIIGLVIMRSFSFKSFIAMILGLLTLFWIRFTIEFTTDNLDSFYLYLSQILDFKTTSIFTLSIPEKVIIGIIFFISFCNLLYGLFTDQEKIRNQLCYNFILTALVVSFIFLFFNIESITGHLTIIYTLNALLLINYLSGR